ncbi:F28J7.5 protein isoform 1 [Hibiscus syriacus]|uniref:F28J7.5 protein isoform 1 n=1 Tax=Hibiscus syriacus TaxID=106335 RepID=A0A6A2WFU1_HIBSY|nr:F28J7.5 protein isoform 1 [Hibiscus syriacus]
MGKWSKRVVFLFFFAYQFVCKSHWVLPLLPLFKEIRTFKQEDDAHVVHCSRERSRAAWKVIQEYLMPSVEQERYKISSGCRLHPDNDLYRDQEQHKHHVDINEWRCRYCRKNFYEEKYLDKHFDNRHFDLLNASHGRCLADLCGALHCDLVMDSSPHKTKCNPAAARNKHLCESLADGCFPISNAVSSRLHEAKKYTLHNFIDFDVDAAAAFLLLHLHVPKGN